jgi:hypothetical protein
LVVACFALHWLCTDGSRKTGRLTMSVPLWQRPITDFFKTTHAKSCVKSIKSVSERRVKEQHLITEFFSRTTAFVSVPVPYSPWMDNY